METDKIHFLTEAIYRNLMDNYSPGIKQFINSGRAYQKALHNVATVGNTYIQCIYNLAQSAQVCKGATSEIGAALVQIAEVFKEINVQIIDNIKTFHAEVLIPLESKQDSELKHLQVLHKKYQGGHKVHASARDKAESSLKKHKKKAKAKFGFDQKEIHYNRELKECQSKLEEYHLTCLKTVLIEERKRYCTFLDSMCGMVRNSASHHSKAHEMLTHRLPEWQEQSRNPHFLPETSEAVIQAFKNQQEDVYSTTDEISDMRRRSSYEYERSGSPARDTTSMTYGSALGGHRMGAGGGAGHGGEEYAVASLIRPVNVVAARPQVRVLYPHESTSDTQLNLKEGDVVGLVGEPRAGWQYGENTRTSQLGWFPLSFTEPLHTGSADAHVSYNQRLLAHQRVKSLGNLQEITGEDFNQMTQSATMPPGQPGAYSDSDSGHGRDPSERPKSMMVGLNHSKWFNDPTYDIPPPLQFQDYTHLSIPDRSPT